MSKTINKLKIYKCYSKQNNICIEKQNIFKICKFINYNIKKNYMNKYKMFKFV